MNHDGDFRTTWRTRGPGQVSVRAVRVRCPVDRTNATRALLRACIEKEVERRIRSATESRARLRCCSLDRSADAGRGPFRSTLWHGCIPTRAGGNRRR